MIVKRYLLGGVGLVAAGSLAACGTTAVSTSQFHGEARNVAQTISDFQRDSAARDQNKVCNNDLASTVVDRLKATGGGCTTVINNQLKEVDNTDLSLASAGAITITGNTATARVKSTSGSKTRFDTLTLVKEGSGASARWKISALQ